LSAVVNGGGLGQLGDIVHSFNAAFDGRQGDIHDLITHLDTFVGTFDAQRSDVIATMQALNRLAGTFAAQRDVLTAALNDLPPALEVLVRERPRITTALDKLRVFSDTAYGLVTDVRADLVDNLHHLEPSIRSLADVGAEINKALAFATVFPYGQSAIDHAVRGDYINQITTIDFTVPRLKRELLMGTRFGDPNAQLQAAIGDPGYAEQTGDPLGVAIAPPPAPAEAAPPPDQPLPQPLPADNPGAAPATPAPSEQAGR
jgi:ABC-type transporter Mla subunit MlaD